MLEQRRFSVSVIWCSSAARCERSPPPWRRLRCRGRRIYPGAAGRPASCTPCSLPPCRQTTASASGDAAGRTSARIRTHRVAPGFTPSMSQESLLLRMRRTVSACSLVKPTLTSDTGRFPPFSHMSVMEEKNACGGNQQNLRASLPTSAAHRTSGLPGTSRWCPRRSVPTSQSSGTLWTPPTDDPRLHPPPAALSGPPEEARDQKDWPRAVQHVIDDLAVDRVGPCWRRRRRRCCPCWPESPSPASSPPASCPGRRSSPWAPRRTPAALPGCLCRTRYGPETQSGTNESLSLHLLKESRPSPVSSWTVSPRRRKDVQPCRRCSPWFLCLWPELWHTPTHTSLRRTAVWFRTVVGVRTYFVTP